VSENQDGRQRLEVSKPETDRCGAEANCAATRVARTLDGPGASGRATARLLGLWTKCEVERRRRIR